MRAVIVKATNEMLGVEGATGVPAFNATIHRLVDIPPGWPTYNVWQSAGIDGAGFYPVDQAEQVWNGKAWVDDPAKVEPHLIADVKAEGERRRMLVLSPGGSKKTVYSLKQSEVDSWNDLGSTLATQLTAALGLSVIKQKRKFRFAMAEAALRGEPNPSAAIARFAAGSDAANAEAARIEAIEQAGVAAIKAATTAAAKRAAYAAINWDWKP